MHRLGTDLCDVVYEENHEICDFGVDGNERGKI